MYILGIETSCDDTGVAIYNKYSGIIANQLSSQINLHKFYNGVVPELASREHIKNVSQLIFKAINQANLKLKDINGIAYTAGPGLIGSLIVGATLASSLAYVLKIPIIAIHHMEGHLLTPMIEDNPPKFPFIALLVSGGHTQLVLAKNIGKYQILGKSLDDSVGDTFDKVAKLLELPYPGGPSISKIAKYGISGKYIFPRPLINENNFSFSFSGLKTFVKNILKNNINKDKQIIADIAKSFEDAVVDVLTIKCKRAMLSIGCNRLVVAGGVSANKKLRNKLNNMVKTIGGETFYARPELCTDNGVMIAYAGMIRFNNKIEKNDLSIFIKSKWSLEDID